MKSTIHWLILLLATTGLAFASVGCEKKEEGGDEKEEKAEEGGEEGAEGEGAEGAEGAEGEGAEEGGEEGEGDETAAAEEEPEEEKPPITPMTYDGSPIAPTQFAEAFNAWKEKEVVVAGHPVFFFDEDVLKGSVALNLDPTDKKKKPLECKMKADDDEKFSKQKVAVLKGTFEKFWGRDGEQVILKDCEKVEIVDELPPKVENLDPETYDGTTPLPLDQYLEAVHWKDKEVTLIASFNGSTTSTTKSGKTYRIDLQDVNGDGSKVVSCYLTEPVPEENVGSGRVWQFTGVATGDEAFDRPEIQNCQFDKEIELKVDE